MMKLVIIGLGGFLGAVLRYGASGLAHRWAGAAFPYGTLLVNVSGCFLLGAVLYLAEDRALFGVAARGFLAIGVLGAFTTFSTFGYETLELLRAGQSRLALVNVAASVVLGLAAVWAGRATLEAIGV